MHYICLIRSPGQKAAHQQDGRPGMDHNSTAFFTIRNGIKQYSPSEIRIYHGQIGLNHYKQEL